MTSLRVGRFSSHPDRLRGERSLGSMLLGQHFDRIEVSMTPSEFDDLHLHQWLRRLHCRLSDPSAGVIVIEVRP